MLDISDGLAVDAAHIAARSGCRVAIELERVPLAEGAMLEDVGFGEDYELLAATPDPLDFTVVGRCEEGSGVGVTLHGKPVELEPLSPGGQVNAGPLGDVDTIFTLHSEVLTFPTSFGCEECAFRLSLHPDLEQRLRDLTTAPKEEVEAATHSALPPSPNTVSVHVVDADGVRVTAVTRSMEEWGLGGGVVSTAAPAAAARKLRLL